MSKYNLSWDEKKLQRYIKEGRGQGVGKEYKPWITIHDFPSKGFSSRQPGWKNERICHFLSHNELRYFYLLEWSDLITDIREQYPMELDKTLEIADKLCINHPKNRESKTPYVMTTDFMITLSAGGKEYYKARTIKPAADLEKKNYIEHFEIERRYWAGKGIDWGIVTDNDIPKIFISNIEWAYYSYNLEADSNMDRKELLYLGELLKDRITKREGKIVRVTAEFDKDMNLEPGTSLNIFKHLVAQKEISMDMLSKRCTDNSTDAITRIERKNDRLEVV